VATKATEELPQFHERGAAELRKGCIARFRLGQSPRKECRTEWKSGRYRSTVCRCPRQHGLPRGTGT
jgi:hypothetical protein